MKTKKLTCNALIASMFLQMAPLSSSFAQDAGSAPKVIDQTQISINVSDIIEKQYESENPDVHASFGEKLMKNSKEGMKQNISKMLVDFRKGVKNAVELAGNGSVDGRNVPVVIGVKDGWKMLKKYGKAAGVHYVDSVRYLPAHLKEVGAEFKKEGKDIANLTKKNYKHTSDYWKKTSKSIDKDIDSAIDAYKDINDWAKDGYKNSYTNMKDGIKDGYKNSVDWSTRVYKWTKEQNKQNIIDLKVEPIKTAKATIDLTKRTGKFFTKATVNTLKASSYAAYKTMEFTKKATIGTYKGSLKLSKDINTGTNTLTKNMATWLNKNSLKPLTDHAVNGIKKFTKYNMDHGVKDGIKGGFKTASNAYSNRDYLMGTIWAVAGIGKSILHVLVLEPTITPLIAAYGVAGTTALTTVGYPSVGLTYGLGKVGAGLTYATGLGLTGSVATLGTVGTLGAAGLGSVGTVAVAGTGIVSTVGVAVGGTALTIGNYGYQAGKTLLTPVIGGIGMTGAFAGGVAEILGSTVWNSGKIVGISALTPVGYSLVTTVQASKISYKVLRATGVTIYDNAIATPIGVVGNLAQAIGSGAWTLAEDPAKGTLNLLAASGVTLGTIVTSTGGFAYEFLKGTAKALKSGIATTIHAGGWVVGATAKVVEVVFKSQAFKKHAKWGEFHRGELEAMLENTDAKLRDRLGNIEMIRVFAHGKRKGKVKSALLKNSESKERFFIKRLVDADTCKVHFNVSNKGALVRLFSKRAYTEVLDSGLYDKVCDQASK